MTQGCAPGGSPSNEGVLFAFNKPYGVLSQFTPEPDSRWKTLAGYGFPHDVYPLGRLDADSEGLLLLTDEPGLNARLLHPSQGHRREYWVQVERLPTDASLSRLARGGIDLGDYRTRPCTVRRLGVQAAELAPRDPPIRVRKNVPDEWLTLELVEGKNRQVRRMTAAIGHPTLRLIRVRIGALTLASLRLASGHGRAVADAERAAIWVSE